MRTLKFRSYDTIEQAYCPFITDHLKRDLYPHIDVQQWTGLLSKDGVGIYEGDIITTKFHGTYVDRVAWDGPPDATAEVYWDYCSFNLRARGEKDERFATFEDLADYVDWKHLQYLHMATEHTEVIGNIYENPELLK